MVIQNVSCTCHNVYLKASALVGFLLNLQFIVLINMHCGYTCVAISLIIPVSSVDNCILDICIFYLGFNHYTKKPVWLYEKAFATLSSHTESWIGLHCTSLSCWGSYFMMVSETSHLISNNLLKCSTRVMSSLT